MTHLSPDTTTVIRKVKRIPIRIYTTVTKHTSLEQLIIGKGVKYLSNIGGTCYIVTYQ